jgi:hypothetical protein
VKIKRVWLFERTVFVSKTMLFLIAVSQIRHCRFHSMRRSPKFENIKICFRFFFALHSIFLEEDRILKGLAVNSLIIVTGHLLSSGWEPRPVIYATACGTCSVCCKSRWL